MASEYTSHYNLDLYADSDKPNLRDQYNGAMNKVDQQLYKQEVDTTTANSNANDAVKKAEAASDAVTKETARSEAAEKANADAVANEAARAEAAEKANADAVANEAARAEAAEKANADGAAKAQAAADNAAAKASENKIAIDRNSSAIGTNASNISKNEAAISAEAERAKTAEKANSDAIEKLGATKTIIMTFGDSYAEAEVDANTWPYQLGLASGCTIKNYAISGAGFDVGGNLFSTQLNTAVSDNTIDKSKVKALVLAGGRNDIMSYSTADTLAYSWARTALSAFPDAKVYIVPMLYDAGSCGDTGRIKAAGIADGAMRAGAIVVNYAWTWLRGLPNQIQSDKVHPNATGARTIANYIWSAIQGNYNPRHMAYTANWCGAPVYIEACAGLVNIQVQGEMTEEIKAFDIPSFCAPYATASAIMYTNSGSANHILMCDPKSLFVYGASGTLGGVGGTLTFPW